MSGDISHSEFLAICNHRLPGVYSARERWYHTHLKLRVDLLCTPSASMHQFGLKRILHKLRSVVYRSNHKKADLVKKMLPYQSNKVTMVLERRIH